MVDPAAIALLLLSESSGQLGEGERMKMFEKYPAGNGGSDLQAITVFHSSLPNPFQEAGEHLKGRIHFLGAEFIGSGGGVFYVECLALTLIDFVVGKIGGEFDLTVCSVSVAWKKWH